MYKKYSFIRPDPTLQHNLMAFGFDCGPGWYKIIVDCFDKIKSIPAKNRKGFEVVQVKEKYGTLRIFAWNETEEIEKIIDSACELSETTCEHCGQPGYMHVTRGWYSTLCDDCYSGKKKFTGKFNEDNTPIMEEK